MILHNVFSSDNSKAFFPVIIAAIAKGLGLGAKKHTLNKVVKEGTKEAAKDKTKEEINKKDDKEKSE